MSKDTMDWNALLVRFNKQVDQRINKLDGDPSKMRGTLSRELQSIGFDSLTSDAEILARRLALRGADPKGKADMVAALFVNDYLGSLKYLCESSEVCQTRQEVGEVALGLFQYKSDHGAFPENLNALTPNYLNELPVDRFSDEPMIYKQLGDHFMLYSVGYDEQDSFKYFKEIDFKPYGQFFFGDIGFHSDPTVWCDPELRR